MMDDGLLTDDEIRERLREVDELDRDVTDWEAEFINDVAFESGFLSTLSDRQREKALEIIDRYL